jgi:hypothetical protein
MLYGDADVEFINPKTFNPSDCFDRKSIFNVIKRQLFLPFKTIQQNSFFPFYFHWRCISMSKKWLGLKTTVLLLLINI